MSPTDKSVLEATKRPIRSLQSQYIFVALLLGGLVLISATIGYFNIISTSSQLITKAGTTSKILSLTTQLREHANGAYRAIQDFMLDPDRSAHEISLNQEIDESRMVLESLSEDEIIKRFKLQKHIKQLAINYQTLLDESHHLFSIRVSANDQYPALDISSNIMQSLRNDIFSALNLSLLEFDEDAEMKINSKEYALLNKALFNWINTISEYRLYLTNRMGSFDPKRLLDQEVSVDQHVLQFKKIIVKLIKLADQDRLGFEGAVLIRKMPDLIEKWRSAFHKVRGVNHSGEWRKDIAILAKTINPLMDNINLDLSAIDIKVKQEYQSILENQASARPGKTI